jgi:putative ABC transport system permease protein
VNDTIDLFPTITKPNERFLVADLSSVSRYANLSPLNRELLPNELWISTSAPVDDRDRLVGRLSGVNGYRYDSAHNRAERLAGSKVDPLVEAGWRALLFIAFSAVLLLSSVGFLIHAYVSFRSRRLEYALLRTVGMSMRQLMTMIWLEQTLIIVVGLGLGTLLGGMLGNVIMPFLAHNDFGGQVMPPYMMQVSWQVLLTSYAAMLAIFAIIIMGLVWVVHRTSLQRMLRLGEV